MGNVDDSAPDAGWASSVDSFAKASRHDIQARLRAFVGGGGALQERAWSDSIPVLQQEGRELLGADARSADYSTLLEYRLPLEERRADAMFLISDSVVVLELKGRADAKPADMDQAAAYARDLRAYHLECQTRPVHAVLVPMESHDPPTLVRDVWVTGPAHLDMLLAKLSDPSSTRVANLADFLAPEAYRPMPSLIDATRELFHSGTLREVWRAKAATEPAVAYVSAIAHKAASEKSRHLILVTGVPGSGKTLVGMRSVHAHYLDDLAVERNGEKPGVPALFLSGNQPLVQVLQHVLSGAGGGGKTFVRHIKSYLDRYIPRPERVPTEHLLVFDEAQRAFTPDKVRDIHKDWTDEMVASEPEMFTRICERMPEWSVLVGLIGTGQEIYSGEEGGLLQWRTALENSPASDSWTVHAPASVSEVFEGSRVRCNWVPALNLDTELRFHSSSKWHAVVAEMLSEQQQPDQVREKLHEASDEGLGSLRLWLTRDLETARMYMRERYAEDQKARYGLLASSRDKLLESYGVPNAFPQYSRIRVGAWFADGEDSAHSCRHLRTCVTEFQSQGLELDMTLLAWGNDFVRDKGRWSSKKARSFQRGAVEIRNAHRLRENSYRVLLTRGRDGTVVFMPPERELDETWDFLRSSGFEELS